MDWKQAQTIARDLMDAHGLSHVPFVESNAKRQFGVTTYRVTRRFGTVVNEELLSIGLSKPLTEVNDEACVRDTILHEIAHAKAGHGAGHNYQWKLVAMGLGCNPSHTCGEGVKSVAGKYQATCPCGLDHNMYRMPQRRKICRRCKASLDFKRVL
jgi:predicted SprT family Zn-dependent metalloprotease